MSQPQVFLSINKKTCIDLPDTLALSAVEVAQISALEIERGQWPNGAGRRLAVEMLRGAQNPIILAGLGAVHHGAGPAIQALAEKHRIPVVTTYKAKGIFRDWKIKSQYITRGTFSV